MASQSSSINYKQAAQVAAVAIVYGVIPPSNPVSQIGAFALGILACKGVAFIAPYVKAYKCAYQCVSQLDSDLPKAQQLKDELKNGIVKTGQYPYGTGKCLVKDSRDLAGFVQKDLPTANQMDFSCPDVICNTHPEIAINILGGLSIEDISNFSAASKCCYLSTKINEIWEGQLNQLIPGRKTIPFQECGFTYEQQTKMIYKKYGLLLNSLKKQYQQNAEKVRHLRGPNGFDGAIDRAWKGFQASQHQSDEKRYLELNHQLWNLVGGSYDGTESSFQAGSEQAILLSRIKIQRSAIEIEQGTQEKFSEFILTEKQFKQHLELEKMNEKIRQNLQELNKNLAVFGLSDAAKPAISAIDSQL